jgi:hypothetical protein
MPQDPTHIGRYVVLRCLGQSVHARLTPSDYGTSL